MTNLIPSARRRWINRGRVLVGLPIAFGLFFSSLLFLLVLRPIWQDVQELERRRDSLLNLQRNLPALQQQLEKETVVLAQLREDNSLLLELLLKSRQVALQVQQRIAASLELLYVLPDGTQNQKEQKRTEEESERNRQTHQHTTTVDPSATSGGNEIGHRAIPFSRRSS